MNDAKLQMVKLVLHWVWDPIGVRGIGEALDEYDGYAPQVLELLEQGSSNDEVAARLRLIEVEWMELKPHRDRSKEVAALLCELHALFT
jgi:hypothetical protein